MNKLPTWQKPVAWTIIVLAFPFVCLWRAYVSAKWTVWAGRIYLKEVRRG